MKILQFIISSLGLVLLPVFAQDDVLILDSEWRFSAGYAVGYADYIETGNIFVVQSDWQGWNSTFNFKVEKDWGSVVPYIRIRGFNSEYGVEFWQRDGVNTQVNDMKVVGGDISFGISTNPFNFHSVNITPKFGLIARYQDFERKNFAYFTESRRLIFGQAIEVNELIQTYGIGGGVVLNYFISEQWMIAADTEIYGLFFSSAENDFFDASIKGNSGLFGSSGLFSESSIMLVKLLKNPNYRVGIRINADLQWIEGGSTGSFFRNDIVEWPENRLRNLALDLYWRGTF